MRVTVYIAIYICNSVFMYNTAIMILCKMYLVNINGYYTINI
jgi:hypothetical protein